MNDRAQLQAGRAFAVLAAGAALVLVAFVFDAAPLFVPGVALAAIGVAAPLWVLWSARGAGIRRLLDTERVVEGGELHCTLEVHRPLSPDGWGRLEVVDPLSQTRAGLGGPGSPLRRCRSGHIRVVARFDRRGEQRLPAPTLIARDPLELARARRVADNEAQTVLVLPRTGPVQWLSAGGGVRTQSHPPPTGDTRAEAQAATDLEGLRPYRPGTPASRIHWPALARGRGLIERRLAADADQRPLVVLDARSRGDDDGVALDAAVRATGSLVLALARAGGCGLLLPGRTRPVTIDAELSAWPAAHAHLAIVGTAAEADRDGSSGAGASDRPPALPGGADRAGPLIYVAAVSHPRLIATLTHAGSRNGVVLVVPESEIVDGRPRGAGARARPALSVSGCRGFTLGVARRPDRPAGQAGWAGTESEAVRP